MLAITSTLRATVNNFSLFQKREDIYTLDYFNTYKFRTIMIPTLKRWITGQTHVRKRAIIASEQREDLSR